jgi:hypothetical protein
MNEQAKFEKISPYHTVPELTWTIKRILDKLREELQQETVENEATTQFDTDLKNLEKEYDGIPDIVSKYQAAYVNFVGTMKDTAKRNWDDIKSWTDDEVPDNIADAITELRKGEFYDQKEETLRSNLETAWWDYHSQLSYFDYFSAWKKKAEDDFSKAKEFEKTVGDWFSELENLHATAKEYMEANKHKSTYAVRLEYQELWEKTLELDDGTSTEKNPEWLKNHLTGKLRALIVATHEAYLWHNKQLKSKESFETAKSNYDTFVESRRESFIREAQDVEPGIGNTTSNDNDSTDDTPEPEEDPIEPEVAEATD